MGEPHECPLSEVIVGVDGDPTWTTSAPYPRPSCNGSGGQGTIRKPPYIKEGQMSEKKGPFDAAIAVLKTELRECSPDEEDEFCDFIQSLTDNQYEKGLRIAIRVLEAAGKVDKVKLHLRCGSLIRLTPELDALLDALPEKEE